MLIGNWLRRQIMRVLEEFLERQLHPVIESVIDESLNRQDDRLMRRVQRAEKLNGEPEDDTPATGRRQIGKPVRRSNGT